MDDNVRKELEGIRDRLQHNATHVSRATEHSARIMADDALILDAIINAEPESYDNDNDFD